MGLLSTLRAAPKSATIRTELERIHETRTTASARLVTVKEAWRKAVLDGTEQEKASTRAAVRSAEQALEELQLQDEALATLLQDTEAEEQAQAERDQWAADVKATRSARARTDKLLDEYAQHASALATVVRSLCDIATEWSEVEARREQDGRLVALLDEAKVNARPGATSTGKRLWMDNCVQRLPRLDEGQGPYYAVTPW